jgi:(1->4)-alpha-D-glucan 1-alpha-D-glucosylmutase
MPPRAAVGTAPRLQNRPLSGDRSTVSGDFDPRAPLHRDNLPAVSTSNSVHRLPRATYRLQLRAGFGFEEARQLIDYLARLGISDLYLSPLFRARKDSDHGYDVVDHTRVEPSFGDLDAFRGLAREAREAGLGILLDIVPNHMGINDPGNVLWNDVLENGPAARHAAVFDIDWSPPQDPTRRCVLLPFLGRPFGEALEAGELTVAYEDERFKLLYYERRFPIAPSTWPPILQSAFAALSADAPFEVREELASIITQLERLPPSDRLDAIATEERYREQAIARRRLGTLFGESRHVRTALQSALHALNGEPGQPRSYDALEALLSRQHYRLAYWRVAMDEINYRRFFEINDLVAVRVELPEVFERVHRLTMQLLQEGLVTGLRIDHPDGLLDPGDYFRQLQSAYRSAQPQESAQRTSLYVVAEKILTGDERLRSDWQVQGTTGYAFMHHVASVLVDSAGVQRLQEQYPGLTGQKSPARDVIYQSKQTILHEAMSSDLFVQASQLFRLARSDRRTCDWTLPVLLRALREIIACFPVYRTYIRPVGWEVDAEDHGRILDAVRWAKRRNPTMSWAAFDFIAAIMLLRFPPHLSSEQQAAWRAFAVRMQQVTAPVTAKGVEDTAFYRYYPLASLNEVGGELGSTGMPVEHFHRLMQHRRHDWPASLSATATHDTKRGEDVRARLSVISECPDQYAAAFREWDRTVQPFVTDVDGDHVPDANERYLIHQTLLGAWPLGEHAREQWDSFTPRMHTYFEKAFREAKLHTSWLNPSEAFEEAVRRFVSAVLADREAPACRQLRTWATRLAGPGYVNGLAQVVLKGTLPGVPDFYQGNEFWDFRLVDPDNRQPVDFTARAASLSQLAARHASEPQELWNDLRKSWSDALKQYVTWRTLDVRRRYPSLLAEGDYRPLEIHGQYAAHALAFARTCEQQSLIVVAPLHVSRLVPTPDEEIPPPSFYTGAVWGDTAIQLPDDLGGAWQDESGILPVPVSPGRLRLADAFARLPVSLLLSTKG